MRGRGDERPTTSPSSVFVPAPAWTKLSPGAGTVVSMTNHAKQDSGQEGPLPPELTPETRLSDMTTKQANVISYVMSRDGYDPCGSDFNPFVGNPVSAAWLRRRYVNRAQEILVSAETEMSMHADLMVETAEVSEGLSFAAASSVIVHASQEATTLLMLEFPSGSVLQLGEPLGEWRPAALSRASRGSREGLVVNLGGGLYRVKIVDPAQAARNTAAQAPSSLLSGFYGWLAHQLDKKLQSMVEGAGDATGPASPWRIDHDDPRRLYLGRDIFGPLNTNSPEVYDAESRAVAIFAIRENDTAQTFIDAFAYAYRSQAHGTAEGAHDLVDSKRTGDGWVTFTADFTNTPGGFTADFIEELATIYRDGSPVRQSDGGRAITGTGRNLPEVYCRLAADA